MKFVLYTTVTFLILMVYGIISVFAFHQLPEGMTKSQMVGGLFGVYIFGAILSTICFNFSCKFLQREASIKYCIALAFISTISMILILFILNSLHIKPPILITLFVLSAVIPMIIKDFE